MVLYIENRYAESILKALEKAVVEGETPEQSKEFIRRTIAQIQGVMEAYPYRRWKEEQSRG